jgi:hypothetical protein
MPAGSTHASEPPPAPIARASTIVSAIGTPYSSSSRLVNAGSEPGSRHASNDVPPMSHAIMSPSPSRRPRLLEAMIPPDGPERTSAMGCSFALAGLMTPPLERRISSWSMPPSSHSCSRRDM